MESEKSRDEAVEDEIAGLRKPRDFGPFKRLGLLAIILLTLPFTWGETSSCNGPVHTYTGFEQLARNPGNTISLAVIFITPVVLGFLQHRSRSTGVRLIFELVAAMMSSVGTLYCLVSAFFGGSLLNKPKELYLAPWVATVASAWMLLDAFVGAVRRGGEMITASRLERAARAAPPAPDPPPS